MILLLEPLADGSLLLLYVGSVVICSLLELFGGWLLEKLFHTRWWDYSNQPLNIGGYICLKFSLAWGIAGVLLMRLIHPALAGLVMLVPQAAGLVLLVVLYAVLLADAVVTGLAAHKLDKDAAKIAHLRAALRQPSTAMAKALGNSAIQAAGRVEEWNLPAKKEALEEQLAESRQSLEARKNAMQEKLVTAFDKNTLHFQLEKLLSSQVKIRARLLKAFPDMQHRRHNGALVGLRQKLAGKESDPPASDEENTPSSAKK